MKIINRKFKLSRIIMFINEFKNTYFHTQNYVLILNIITTKFFY